ncbi:MAG: hypothetical protein ACLPX9_19125 [Rhodomicrobium sp.]
MFFFPFVLEPVAVPARPRVPQSKALALLPQRQSARAEVRPEFALAGAVSEAGSLAVDLLKRALTAIASSMTALGNRANALFAQVAGALAFERMAREAASFFGMFSPGFAQPKRRLGFAGPWIAPAQEPPLLASFGLPGLQANPWPLNPWGMFADALGMWSSVWLPATTPQRRSLYGAPAPITTTFAVPGCSFSFTLG